MDYVKLSLFVPSSIMVLGPSGSGKTEFVLSLIERRNEITTKPISKVYFFYGQYQDRYKEFGLKNPEVVFTDDLKLLENLSDCLCVFDDLLLSFEHERNRLITHMFIQGSHHKNITVIAILQVFAIFQLNFCIKFYSYIQIIS